jgi:beta-lactam-binding protein with PASTA domain
MNREYFQTKWSALTLAEQELIKKALGLLGVFTLVAFACGGAALFVTHLHQPMIVPKIMGMTENQARDTLASKSLNLKILRAQYDDHVPEGLVSEQNPRANSYMKRGEEVGVVISKGNPKVKIPAVVQLSLREAQILLASHRLRIGRESFVSDALNPKDTVLAQVPAEGENAGAFGAVDLLVSSGPLEPSFLMPNLAQQPLEKAFKFLRPAGITLQKIKLEVHDDLDSETILSQVPPAGSHMLHGGTVSLVVSAKSSDASLKARFAKIVFDMPQGNTRRLQIDVFDSTGTRTLYNRMQSPLDHVEVEASVTGKASAQIYLNQEFVKEIPIE